MAQVNKYFEKLNDEHEILSALLGVCLVVVGTLLILWILSLFGVDSSGTMNDPSLYPYINNIEDYGI